MGFFVKLILLIVQIYFLMYKQSPGKLKQPQGTLSPSRKKAYKIINQCLRQNQKFHQYRSNKMWKYIHTDHYDWWAFPINQPSSYGYQYMVQHDQIQIMIKNQKFIKALSENATIVCEAWGYDLQKGQRIQTNHKDQQWHFWPIRLYKMTKSLEIFGLKTQFENAVKYAMSLIKDGKKFKYNQKNLADYFMAKLDQIEQNFKLINPVPFKFNQTCKDKQKSIYGDKPKQSFGKPISQTPCEFGSKCNKKPCPFKHDNLNEQAALSFNPENRNINQNLDKPSVKNSQMLCKFDDSCFRPNSRFKHPNRQNKNVQKPRGINQPKRQQGPNVKQPGQIIFARQNNF